MTTSQSSRGQGQRYGNGQGLCRIPIVDRTRRVSVVGAQLAARLERRSELGQRGVLAELGVLRGVHRVQRDPAVGIVVQSPTECLRQRRGAEACARLAEVLLAEPAELGLVDVPAADPRGRRKQNVILSPLTGCSGEHGVLRAGHSRAARPLDGDLTGGRAAVLGDGDECVRVTHNTILDPEAPR
jgi:hypothetical protein